MAKDDQIFVDFQGRRWTIQQIHAETIELLGVDARFPASVIFVSATAFANTYRIVNPRFERDEVL